MTSRQSVLSSTEVQAYYDHFGSKQDSQGFYEDPAVDDLINHSDFEEAQRVLELGCGTGKLAARLLAQQLPASATYLGYDLSPTMVGLATHRLKGYGERARVAHSDANLKFPLPDHSVDRVVCCYVLDLLSEDDIRRFFAEAYRVLDPAGRLCLASLTHGVTLASRMVSSLWMTVFRLRPSLVGGCRPIRLDPYVDSERWQVEHRRVLTPFGVPSEVLVLRPSSAAKAGAVPSL